MAYSVKTRGQGQQPYVWGYEPDTKSMGPASQYYNAVKIGPTAPQRAYAWGSFPRKEGTTFTSPRTEQQPFQYDHRFTRATDIPGIVTDGRIPTHPSSLIGWSYPPTRKLQAPTGPMSWDWGSFGWGVLAGGVIAVAVGGIVLYFAWPTLATIAGISRFLR